jgi:hypothetical protein
MDKSSLPSWIAESLATIEASLSERSRKHFTSFVKAHALLTSTLGELSPHVKILEIKNTSPQYLEAKFGDAYKGLALCVESFIFQWGYQNFYKILSWTSGLLKALEDGNFLLAASCSRGLFEQICHFDFYLSRLERVTQKTITLWQDERKNILKGKMPSEKWRVSYVQSQLEIIQYALKAMRGSDYDWKAWLMQALQSAGNPVDSPDRLPQEFDRKTHINSCIEAVEKRHKVKIERYYDILCDLVHPNFGSNTLVVVTREDLGDQIGHVELSYAPRNAEAAAWFFEVLSEPMHEIIGIAVKDIHLANRMTRFFQEQATGLAGSSRQA